MKWLREQLWTIRKKINFVENFIYNSCTFFTLEAHNFWAGLLDLNQFNYIYTYIILSLLV